MQASLIYTIFGSLCKGWQIWIRLSPNMHLETVKFIPGILL